jgi:pyrroloquinoline quinone biosynthesis protein D
VSAADVPRLAPHVRLRRDAARDRWVLLAPDRLFVPSPTALAVLQRCDGHATVDALVDALAAEYAAPRARIAADVQALLAHLVADGLVTW